MAAVKKSNKKKSSKKLFSNPLFKSKPLLFIVGFAAIGIATLAFSSAAKPSQPVIATAKNGSIIGVFNPKGISAYTYPPMKNLSTGQILPQRNTFTAAVNKSGTKMAYVSNFIMSGNTISQTNSVYTSNIDGSGETKISDLTNSLSQSIYGSKIAWSPNEQELALVLCNVPSNPGQCPMGTDNYGHNTDIYILNIATKQLRRHTQVGNVALVAWSNTNVLAYAKQTSAGTEIHSLTMTTRPADRLLHTVSPRLEDMAWSYSADKLAFVTTDVSASQKGKIQYITPASRKITPVTVYTTTDQLHNLAWAPDGTTLAFTRNNPPSCPVNMYCTGYYSSGVFSIPTVGGAPAQVAGPDHELLFWQPIL